MSKIIKFATLIMAFVIVLAGVIFVFSNTFQPLNSYISYDSSFGNFYLSFEDSTNEKLQLGLANNRVRIHKELHDKINVLFCEEENNTNCFVSSSLLLLPELPESQLLLLKGKLPEPGEIVVSESISTLLDLDVGDTVLLKDFLNYLVLNVSGIIKDTYGFPNEYDSNQVYTVILANTLDNWKTFQPFTSYSYQQSSTSYNQVTNYSSSIRKSIFTLTIILQTILFLMFVVVHCLSFQIFGVYRFLKHQILLGKGKKYLNMYLLKSECMIYSFLCIILLITFHINNIGIAYWGVILVFTFIITYLIQAKRIKRWLY